MTEDAAKDLARAIGQELLVAASPEDQPLVLAAVPGPRSGYATLAVCVEGPSVQRAVEAHVAVLLGFQDSCARAAELYGLMPDQLMGLVLAAAARLDKEGRRTEYAARFDIKSSKGVVPGQITPPSPTRPKEI